MALNEYHTKRDFKKTAEPRGRIGKASKKPIFVIQEHHASRLHYDFRLEADGVLKSWAVPKEPTLDPSEKRLAVHVEDHPLDYAKFHGTIPAGQYGAGTVKIWDHGTYDNVMATKPSPRTVSEGVDDGHIEVVLHGRKLRGTFALVRMHAKPGDKRDNWLLIKMKDDEAKPAKKPPVAVEDTPPHPEDFEITHPTKVLFPGEDITKADVVTYYYRSASRFLPHLRDRPVTLERLPGGIGAAAPHFWQKDLPKHFPEWLPRVTLPTAEGKDVHYALINDVPSLLYLVNQGSLTFHVWLSRLEDLDRPDYVLFDVDPGAAPFTDVVTIARQLHDILDDAGVKSLVKTSGKTGLHILTPWQMPGGYDAARGWAEEMAALVVAALPKLATTERSKVKRRGRVYVDVMQNGRGRTVVPPYVLRPVAGAPVSTPLSWREVTDTLDPTRFNLKTIFRRLARQKRDPLAALAGRGD